MILVKFLTCNVECSDPDSAEDTISFPLREHVSEQTVLGVPGWLRGRNLLASWPRSCSEVPLQSPVTHFTPFLVTILVEEALKTFSKRCSLNQSILQGNTTACKKHCVSIRSSLKGSVWGSDTIWQPFLTSAKEMEANIFSMMFGFFHLIITYKFDNCVSLLCCSTTGSHRWAGRDLGLI